VIWSASVSKKYLRNVDYSLDKFNLSQAKIINDCFIILQHLEFNGVMRFYYQSQDGSSGQKVATKCIRVTSNATTKDIIETLIEKFRPDMKMLEVPEYALYEIHESGERRLGQEEKPLLVQVFRRCSKNVALTKNGLGE
jgi:hypothetical protein